MTKLINLRVKESEDLIPIYYYGDSSYIELTRQQAVNLIESLNNSLEEAEEIHQKYQYNRNNPGISGPELGWAEDIKNLEKTNTNQGENNG